MLVIMYGLDLIFTNTFQNKGTTVKAQWLNRMENEAYDFAIIGSSRGWWNIDVNEINIATQKRGISLSNNHFRNSEILLRLKKFYQHGNTCNRLFLQVDYNSVGEEGFSSTVSNYLPFIDDSTTYHSIVEQDPNWMIYKYVPFWRYAEYNFQWGPEEFLVTEMGLRNTLFDSTGTYFSNDQFYGLDGYYMDHKVHSDAYLSDIVSFCKEQNIQLTLFTSPYLNLELNELTRNSFHDAINHYGLQHIDHTHLYSERKYFNNYDHLSKYGGAEYTKVLIQDFF